MPESEERLRSLYRACAVSAGGHLLEPDWERLACREMAGPERESALEHVTRCGECARIYRALDALAEGAREFDSGAPRREAAVLPFSRGVMLGGLATAAALAILLLRPAAAPEVPHPPAGDSFRGSTATLDPVPEVPAGRVVGLPAQLRWRGISGPASYHVVILDADGEPVWSGAETRGTALSWPSELELKPGSYYWQVIAQPEGGLPGDRRASTLAAFEVVTSSRP
jgi:hypothetical protein